MRKGILYGIGAYALWGLFPIYWKLLHDLPALQVIGHRIAWSFIFLMAAILISRQGQAWRAAIQRPRILLIYLAAGVLVGVNWLIYVWAVNADYIVETSLGYFINPLLSVLLGVIFLRERLRPAQWLPVALAAVGVLYLSISYGKPPWIALSLAFTFATYGLVKKAAPLNSLFGLTLETGLLFVPAVAYLIFLESRGQGAFLHSDPRIDLLLAGAGIVTTIPLLLFASAARRIPLTLVGLLQYIAPTIQFLLGTLVYKEPFSHNQLIGFGIVWIALIIFWAENYLVKRVPVPPLPELGEG
ncbi:MAG TPA: EamA family transporter RarD [Anaerolineales bacterium]|jgi:chloramphenicol-sensitive protein RarD